jgi:mRNA (guanine-N7-)-methyltransferase
MEDTVSLILIEPHESNNLYRDAFQSYKEIYNNSMAKGKGNLEPKFLGGNPIQLDSNNMNSLFSVTDSSKLEFGDYFISTKANGLRFMLLIGNKDIGNGTRRIYLVDSRMNFWYIRQLGKGGSGDNVTGILPSIPIDLNVDKCLIDGELLFWGFVKTRVVNKQIKEFEISKIGNNKPLIAFLAFDILYGPINPDYVRSEEEYSHLTTFQLGNSAPMIGPKAVGRWPTTRRRHVLEQMFLNKDSPLWEYLHIQSPYNLNTISMSRKGNTMAMLEGIRYNFTIFVSPFIKMKELFEKVPSPEIYDTMKRVFMNAIENQYYVISTADHVSRLRLQLPSTPLKFSAEKEGLSKGKGLSTDGLIFTPAFESYLVGSWTFCNNKQYKWKPVNDLTIDFEVGKQLKTESEDAYYYEALVRRGKSTNLEYVIDSISYKSIIQSETELTRSSIVECIFSKKDTDSESLIFDVVQERYDKTEPNAFLTATSVLNAANIRNELDFLKKMKEYGPKPSVLDLALFVKNNKLSSEQKLKVLEALSKDKLIKCCVKKNPLLLFGSETNKILQMIVQKQNNNSYELELRIDFKNPNYNYSNCLISRFIDSEYIPVPVVKIYDESNKKSSLRSVYALLGDEPVATSLLLEETIDKSPIDSVKISDLVYNYDFGVFLTDEIKREGIEIKHGSKGAGNTEYQNRYSITNISKFWRIDIIEYGNARDLKQAKSMWEQKPKTRIEIEYAPASYTEDLLKWENEGVLDLALKQLGFSGLDPDVSKMPITRKGLETIAEEGITRDLLLTKLENYKTILNNTDPREVLKDLGNVLIKIFTVLDMDVGNNYGQTQTKHEVESESESEDDDISSDEESDDEEETNLKKKEQKELKKLDKEWKKEWEVVPTKKVDTKENTQESIFSRLRKFHNFIKSEMIGEIASQFKKPISLLDISVGKGGDLQKWHNSDIEIVYGIDPDAESIKEAKQRFAEAVKEGRITSSRKYTFEQKPISDPNVYINKKFDIVSCQFTLHYFFKDDSILEMVISKVSGALKQGGYFIGTTLLGNKVKELTRNNNFTDKVIVEEVDENSYKMKLLDTAQIYNKDLIEYYVDFDKFKRICATYGMELREAKPFAEMYKMYKREPKNKKHQLRDYELAVSSLNTTFVFQKRI